MTSKVGDTGVMDKDAILNVIPHRSPFLFLDRIHASEPGDYARSSWRVPEDHPILVGHFPGNPIFPGVLLIELMAQTAACAISQTAATEGLYLLVRVESATFTRKIQPGEEVTAEARISRQVNDFLFFSCECYCEGEPAARASLIVTRKV